MIEKYMRLRLLKKLITYGILILYVLIPVLDSIVCADCIGSLAPQRGAAICHLQSPLDEVAYTAPGGGRSQTPSGQAAPTFCSICADFPTGVEGFSQHVHSCVAQWVGPSGAPPLSEYHNSIIKPPQNIFG